MTQTFDEYLVELERIAMGWLGWTEEETLNADMNAILSAYEGLRTKLEYIYGAPEKQSINRKPNQRRKLTTREKLASAANAPPITPAAFDKLFPGKPSKDV